MFFASALFYSASTFWLTVLVNISVNFSLIFSGSAFWSTAYNFYNWVFLSSILTDIFYLSFTSLSNNYSVSVNASFIYQSYTSACLILSFKYWMSSVLSVGASLFSGILLISFTLLSVKEASYYAIKKQLIKFIANYHY